MSYIIEKRNTAAGGSTTCQGNDQEGKGKFKKREFGGELMLYKFTSTVAIKPKKTPNQLPRCLSCSTYITYSTVVIITMSQICSVVEIS